MPQPPTPSAAATAAVEPPQAALVDLGRMDYREAWELQKSLVTKLEGKSIEALNAILFVEHPHVFTLGRRGREGANVLDAGPVPVIEVERGGDVTYHGPGQLVAYPIFRLTPEWQDVRRFVNGLQQALSRTVAAFGIAAGLRRGEPGLWVVEDPTGELRSVPELADQPRHAKAVAGQPQSLAEAETNVGLDEGCYWRKLASLGVAITHWVTYHGLALNVNTDLSYFDRINPCGFEASTMTSMSRLLGRKITVEQVKPVLAAALAAAYCVELEQTPLAELEASLTMA